MSTLEVRRTAEESGDQEVIDLLDYAEACMQEDQQWQPPAPRWEAKTAFACGFLAGAIFVVTVAGSIYAPRMTRGPRLARVVRKGES